MRDPRRRLRVMLAEPDRRSLDAVEVWFDTAWSEIYGRKGGQSGSVRPTAYSWLNEPPAGRVHRVVTLNDQPIGLIAFSNDNGELLIHELATAPAHRNQGFGAEAVYATEASTRAFRAGALVPVTNGLAVYFWLRIGYRPLFLHDHEQRGFTLMVRDPGSSHFC